MVKELTKKEREALLEAYKQKKTTTSKLIGSIIGWATLGLIALLLIGGIKWAWRFAFG